jgi:hypothetical protein
MDVRNMNWQDVEAAYTFLRERLGKPIRSSYSRGAGRWLAEWRGFEWEFHINAAGITENGKAVDPQIFCDFWPKGRANGLRFDVCLITREPNVNDYCIQSEHFVDLLVDLINRHMSVGDRLADHLPNKRGFFRRWFT